MSGKYPKQKVTVRRSLDEVMREELPKLHRDALLTLHNYCILAGVGYYVGKARRDGTIPLKFYTSDGTVEDFINPEDNAVELVANIAADVLPKAEQRMLADDLTGLARSKGAGATQSGALVRRALKPDSEA